jgi:Mg2+-importing ATPase
MSADRVAPKAFDPTVFAPARLRETGEFPDALDAYWALDVADLAVRLGAASEGLSSEEAARRLKVYGSNELREHREVTRMGVFWNQIRSPLVLLLVFAGTASALTAAWVDSAIVLAIVAASVLIGYSREYSAEAAVAALGARVQPRASVIRDGIVIDIPVRDVVPGDVCLLSAGSIVPADGVVLSATSCFVSEAMLTGESFPTAKVPGAVAPTVGLGGRANCVFLVRVPRNECDDRHRALPRGGDRIGNRVLFDRASSAPAIAGNGV